MLDVIPAEFSYRALYQLMVSYGLLILGTPNVVLLENSILHCCVSPWLCYLSLYVIYFTGN